MRILYITHLTDKNGSTLALRNIIQGMIEHGVEVGLVVPSLDGYICEEAKRLGICLLYNAPYPWAMVEGGISFKLYLLAQWRTYKLIKEFQPDVVHCNTGVIDYPLFGCFLARKPMVWHAREYMDNDFDMKLYGGMWLHRVKRHLPFVRNVAITKGVFSHFNLTKKDVVIYDGVLDTSKEIISSPSEKKFFLYVGTFTEGKGVHDIFEQFGAFHLKHPDVELWLACRYDEQSDYYKRCMRFAEDGDFVDRIKFLGFRTDVYALMQKALALIVASRFEGFGFITVEAMYNNCLVIGRDTAGTKEQFDNGFVQTGKEIGLRFTHNSELPQLMHCALTEDFADMKKRAFRVVMNNYTIKQSVDRLKDYYTRILSND